jgi:acetoin utilization deacetylase AcuC-like enzyme
MLFQGKTYAINRTDEQALANTVVPLLLPAQVRPFDSYQRPGASLYGQVCYYAMDRQTPIDENTCLTLRYDMAVVVASIDAIVHQHEQQVYALTTQPGHHAHETSWGGYCFINNAAIIARTLCNHYTRVGLLDVDYHAGNGSMSIFYRDPSVFFASLHADPNLDYPYTCCFADQTGEGEGEGTTINVPLPGKTTWEMYEPQLKRVIEKMVMINEGDICLYCRVFY